MAAKSAGAAMATKVAGAAAAACLGYTLLRSGPPVELAGRVVLVTGAGSGLGRCCALAFARGGCDVVLWDLSQADMDATQALIKEASPGCHCISQRVDVSDPEAVYKAAAEVQALLAPRHVSILVNNAGVSGGGAPLLKADDARVRATFGVNALAHVWTCKAFVPAMLEAGFGHVVTVASIAGLISTPGMVDYAASKAAAVSLTEGLRRELREWHGTAVRTSLVCPAHISTPLFSGFNQLLPSLEPGYVADQVVDSVRHRREMLTLPRMTNPTLAKGLLPVAVLDTACRWLGFGNMMNGVDTAHGTDRVRMMASSKL